MALFDNWRAVQDKTMAHEGENPMPHYWAHVRWAFGAKDHVGADNMAYGRNLIADWFAETLEGRSA